MRQSPLVRLKNRLRPAWFKAGRKWLGSRLKLALLARRNGLAPLSSNPLAALKRSDTLFVLGSGASINTLTESQWAEIRCADSVGFNNWHLHSFIPTFYVNEPGKDLQQLKAEFANLLLRGYHTHKVPILLKDVERYRAHELELVVASVPEPLRALAAFSWDWEIHEQRLDRFKAQLRWLDRFGILTSRACPILRKRASVFYLALLAVRAGYREIVLCGIDLNNADYFYEAQRPTLEQAGYWLPEKKAAASAHKTDDPEFGAVTISAALLALDEIVLKPRGIRLSVALPCSRLHPQLPAYFEHATT